MICPPIEINLVNLGGKGGGDFASTVVNEMMEVAVSSGMLSVKCDHFDIQRAHSWIKTGTRMPEKSRNK